MKKAVKRILIALCIVLVAATVGGSFYMLGYSPTPTVKAFTEKYIP